MGASFQTMTIDGKQQRKEVETLFVEAQDRDRYENGHSYSGGFGMATGLVFEDRTFDNREQAEKFLDEVCVKWEDARAVTFLNENKEATWLIGAMCAS